MLDPDPGSLIIKYHKTSNLHRYEKDWFSHLFTFFLSLFSLLGFPLGTNIFCSWHPIVCYQQFVLFWYFGKLWQIYQIPFSILLLQIADSFLEFGCLGELLSARLSVRMCVHGEVDQSILSKNPDSQYYNAADLFSCILKYFV